MSVANPTKAFLLLVGMICITILMALEKVSTDAGLPLISATVFYAIGNGVQAYRNGTPAEPVLGPKDKK